MKYVCIYRVLCYILLIEINLRKLLLNSESLAIGWFHRIYEEIYKLLQINFANYKANLKIIES